MKDPAGNLIPGGNPSNNGWYSGYNYWNGQWSSAPGAFAPGNPNGSGTVSQEVNNQSAATQGVSEKQFNSYLSNPNPSASNINAPVTVPYSTGATTTYVGSLQGQVDAAKAALQDKVDTERLNNATALTTARGAVQDTLNNIQEVTTPFRQTAEQQGEQQFGTNDVLTSQKALVSELGDLLSQGNELIKQQQSVTGLGSIRNPRVQATMSDITARAGVVQAVISAQNGYLSNAYTAIDRSVDAIAADRQDQLTYYQTVLELQNQDVVSLTKEDQDLAEKQIEILQGNLDEANKTADYVKQLMLDPATAQLMGQAGVTLNDNVETINAKLAQAQYANEIKTESNSITEKGGVAVVNPSSVPAGRLVSFTDSKGVVHYYQMPASSNSSDTVTANNTKVAQYLASNANSYGDVTPATWQKALNAYIQDGGTAAAFVANFSGYADTNRGDFENAYGFKNPASS